MGVSGGRQNSNRVCHAGERWINVFKLFVGTWQWTLEVQCKKNPRSFHNLVDRAVVDKTYKTILKNIPLQVNFFLSGELT